MADGVTINEGTAKIIATDDVSGTQYQVIKLDVGGNGAASPFTGTITEVANLAGGTVTLANPTGTTVTVDHGTITLSNPTGTTVQFNNGTVDLLKAGTITTLPNIPGGTLGLVTSVTEVANLAKGTVTRLEGGTLGVVTSVTDVANLAKGTVTRLEGGTLGVVTSVTDVANLAKGTVTRLEGGTLGLVTTVTNLSNGTIQSSGTTTGVGVVSLLSAGTVTKVEGGSIAVTAGTVAQSGAWNVTGTVVGDIASGASDSGNPVKVGAKYNATLPTLTDGQRGDMQVGSRGALRVSLFQNDSTNAIVTRNDNVDAVAVSSTSNNLAVQNRNTVYNGTSWDRMYGDTRGVYTRRNPAPTVVQNSYGTTTNGTIGTLVAAPSAGSAIIVTSLDISVQSGTVEPVVSWGLAANGNQVLSRGNYIAGGGIAKSYPIPVSGSATGTALTFNILSGSGTVSYNVAYFIAVP